MSNQERIKQQRTDHRKVKVMHLSGGRLRRCRRSEGATPGSLASRTARHANFSSLFRACLPCA